MNKTLAQAEWRKRQKAKGLCIECAEPAEPNRLRCAYHLERAMDRSLLARRMKKYA